MGVKIYLCLTIVILGICSELTASKSLVDARTHLYDHPQKREAGTSSSHSSSSSYSSGYSSKGSHHAAREEAAAAKGADAKAATAEEEEEAAAAEKGEEAAAVKGETAEEAGVKEANAAEEDEEGKTSILSKVYEDANADVAGVGAGANMGEQEGAGVAGADAAGNYGGLGGAGALGGALGAANGYGGNQGMGYQFVDPAAGFGNFGSGLGYDGGLAYGQGLEFMNGPALAGFGADSGLAGGNFFTSGYPETLFAGPGAFATHGGFGPEVMTVVPTVAADAGHFASPYFGSSPYGALPGFGGSYFGSTPVASYQPVPYFAGYPGFGQLGEMGARPQAALSHFGMRPAPFDTFANGAGFGVPGGMQSSMAGMNMGPQGGYQFGGMSPAASGFGSRFGDSLGAGYGGGNNGVFSQGAAGSGIGPDGKFSSYKGASAGFMKGGKPTAYKTVATH